MTRSRWAFWLGSGFWAVMDRGLLAGGSFILNIMLANWLDQEQYGIFGSAYAVFLFAFTVYSAMVTEPLMVYGAGKYSGRFQEYLGSVLRLHVYMEVILLTGLLCVAVIYAVANHSKDMFVYFLGMVAASSMLLTFYMARFAFYAVLRIKWAVLGSMIETVLLLGMVWVLHEMKCLSVGKAFLAMGASAGIAGLLLLTVLRPSLKLGDRIMHREVLVEHWKYGRWATGGNALRWVSGSYLFLAVLPVWIGFTGIGALRALLNLVLPFMQGVTALSAFLLPVFSKQRHQVSTERVRKLILRLFGVFMLGAIFYYLFLVVFSKEILLLLYKHKYIEYAYLIPTIGVLAIVSSFVAVFSPVLKAFERTDHFFLCYLIAAVVMLIAGLPLGICLGLEGAAWGMVLAYMSAAVAMAVFVLGRSQLSREPIAR